MGDISGSIYSQYSELAEGEDNNMAKRCQKDADGILIFVSPHFVIQTTKRIKTEHCRLVYSLPQSLRCSLYLSRT